MGSAKKKPKSMRSKKSGLKTKSRIDKNLEILKKISNEKK